MCTFLIQSKKFTGLFATTNEKALTFKKHRKRLRIHAMKVHIFIWIDRFISIKLRSESRIMMQNFKILLPIILQYGTPMAMLSSDSYQNYEIQEEVLKFAQSVVVFHQDKDSYTMPRLSEHA